MSSQIRHTIIVVLGFTLLGLTACGEKTPPKAPPKAVKQKISAPSPPADKQTASPVPKAAATAEKQSTEGNSQISGPVTASAPGSSDATQADADSTLVKETLQIASTYDPKGRFNPFAPLFKEKITAETEAGTEGKSKRRIPQTPLEKIALSQLKLTAIIRAPSGHRGLVVDATGKGYVVENGTYIGLNSGQVVEIMNDRIIVEEETQNILGELTLQKSELKLQKPAGEL